MNNIQCMATISCVKNRSAVVELYNCLSDLKEEYPKFDAWFFEKVIPGLELNSRKVYLAKIEGSLAGILILKDDIEKKICTLRVLPAYQRQGVGSQLIEFAINELGTASPLITVSDSHVTEFAKLFSNYGFVLTQMHLDRYKKDHIEFVFNGVLD